MAAVMHYVLLRVQEVVEGSLRLLEVLEVMRCVLLCILEAVEGALCLLEDVGDTGGAGGDALCATPYARDYGGCALFAGGARGGALRAALYAGYCGRYALFMELSEVPEVMRCVLRRMLEVLEMLAVP